MMTGDYCKGKDFCTSRCYCTDGKNFTMDDETDQAFDSNEVDDQGNKMFKFYNESH